jgi:hypothetical protein
VASAGLASTALPAASAAAIWPVKMASGKFHGLMQVKATRRVGQLGRAGGVVAQEIDGLAQLGHGVHGRLAGLPRQQREELGRMGLVEVGGTVQVAARSGAGADHGCAEAMARSRSAGR